MDQVYEVLERIPEPVRYAIVFGVAAVIVAVYLFFFRFPAQDELARLESEYEEVHEELLKKKEVADNLQDWQLERDRLQVKVDEALEQLPNEVDTDQLLVTIPNIAKKNGLEVRKFELKGERRKGDYAEVPLQLKMRGTYRGVGGFAQEVGNQPRIMAVRKLKMTKSGDAPVAPRRSGEDDGDGEEGEEGGEDGEDEAARQDLGVPLKIEAVAVTYRFLAGN